MLTSCRSGLTICRLTTIPCETWWRPADIDAVLLPRFKRPEDLNTPVRLLDLNLKLFRKLCPNRKELPLLAHIRHVDTADKVPLEMVANGEFSVLVANRFPPPGTNTVYLISLEGWNGLLDSDPGQPQPASRVRLIILGSWSFQNDPKGHDTFGGLMQQLKKNSAVFGIALPGTSGHAHVDNALKRGYVPLDYKPLQSTPGMAWYRGPLSPFPRQRLNRPAFERADAAMIFDDKNGLMDVSYASAWELGRLLGAVFARIREGVATCLSKRDQNAAEFANEIEKFLEQHRCSFKDPSTIPPSPRLKRRSRSRMIWLSGSRGSCCCIRCRSIISCRTSHCSRPNHCASFILTTTG